MPKKGEQLPVWDLTRFYDDIDDPKIGVDFKKSLALAKSFEQKYRGKLSNKSESEFLEIFREYEKIFEATVKYGYYSYFLLSLNNNDPKVGAFYQKIQTDYQQVNNLLVFFDLELSKLPLGEIKKLLNSKILANYKHHIKRILDYKPHMLTEAEQKIINLKYLTSRAALERMFDRISTTKKFKIKIGKETKEVLQSDIFVYLENKDRNLRKAAAEGLTAGLKEESENLAFILNMLMQDEQIVTELRRYKELDEPRNLDNEISSEVVANLSKTVQSKNDKYRNYLSFKKGVLGLDKMYYYDRGAFYPISSDKTYQFSEVKNIILRGFEKFSKDYAAIAERFFEESRIDALIRPGKTNGAYCAGVSPKIPPYILVNFTGKITDINTLAHELGHGINDVLMQKQTIFNYGVPTILAEIASLFSEMVLFNALMNSEMSAEERFDLITDKIEDLSGNIFRGIAVYEFEKDIHRERRKGNELTVSQINGMWIRRQDELFGKTVETKGGYEYWWSYIGHFYHFSPPFYYYGYAFGALAALALYAKYLKEGNSFVEKYLKFLSVGNSVSPEEALKMVGFDMNDPNVWKHGLKVYEDLIVEAKEIYKQTKKRK